MQDLIIYQSNGEQDLFVQKEAKQVETSQSTTDSIVVTIDESVTYQEDIKNTYEKGSVIIHC